jgi:predicted house-cleaning noncanonical NTP pyrophosphatase (MazG superfamily)/GNAT superfamily N-acetyltransferase
MYTPVVQNFFSAQKVKFLFSKEVYSFYLNCLTRSKIKDTFQKDAFSEANCVELDQKTYQEALKKKLQEEVAEVCRASGTEQLSEELGDVLDVIDALCQTHGLDLETIHAKRLLKTQKKGSFNQHTFVDSVEFHEDSPHLPYFQNNSKYPQLYPLKESFMLGIAEKGDDFIDKIIFEGLREHNEQFTGPYGHPFTLFIKDSTKIIGGINGFIIGESGILDLLWVAPSHRNKGLGKQLIQRTEAFLIAKNCTRLFVDTAEYQAKAFYEKQGYTLEGSLHHWAGPFNRYYFYKNL